MALYHSYGDWGGCNDITDSSPLKDINIKLRSFNSSEHINETMFRLL